MALTWQWADKCGEAIIQQTWDGETKEYTKTLYEGNALLIIMNEWTENGTDMYSLYSFFADEKHAKNCLGLTKGHTNIFENGGTKFKKLRINKAKSSNWKKIVGLFAQAFDNIEIELYTEKTND